MRNNKLIIGIENSNGEIIQKQDFFDFKQGKGSIPIINLYTGQKLFDILLDELGCIKWEENKWVFRYILNQNPLISVMQILGKIAEAIVVRNCNNNEYLNRIWFSKARLKRANKKTVRNFTAIGTGLLSTKKNFFQKYNPSDPQRDIIWIDKNENYALIPNKNTLQSGLVAGLQLKVSSDYHKYILDAILKSKYENPIVYFDLNNDFYNLIEYLISNKLIEVSEVGKNIIQGKSLDPTAHQELLYYYDLVKAIVNNKLTIDDLILNSDAYETKNVLKNALMGTAINKINAEDLLL